MQQRLFVYGTLQLPERVEQIIGRPVSGEPALLEGFRCGLVERADFPGIVREQHGKVEGKILCGLSHKELNLLDQYEGELYQRLRMPVKQQNLVSCWVYAVAPWAYARVTETPWSIEWYRGRGNGVRLTYRT